jgi:hypothetical protein
MVLRELHLSVAIDVVVNGWLHHFCSYPVGEGDICSRIP